MGQLGSKIFEGELGDKAGIPGIPERRKTCCTTTQSWHPRIKYRQLGLSKTYIWKAIFEKRSDFSDFEKIYTSDSEGSGTSIKRGGFWTRKYFGDFDIRNEIFRILKMEKCVMVLYQPQLLLNPRRPPNPSLHNHMPFNVQDTLLLSLLNE